MEKIEVKFDEEFERLARGRETWFDYIPIDDLMNEFGRVEPLLPTRQTVKLEEYAKTNRAIADHVAMVYKALRTKAVQQNCVINLYMTHVYYGVKLCITPQGCEVVYPRFTGGGEGIWEHEGRIDDLSAVNLILSKLGNFSYHYNVKKVLEEATE
jgi:hypothetical protein